MTWKIEHGLSFQRCDGFIYFQLYHEDERQISPRILSIENIVLIGGSSK